jgi:osmotically-inducible protein OsmY
MNKISNTLATAATALFLASPVIAADSQQPVSDSIITTKVKAELAKDSTTSATAIHVKTRNGVVYLTGVVSSSAEKDKASKDAQVVGGVSKVKNHLKVNP